MDLVSGGLTPLAFWAAMAVTFFAGFVKGTIGFAMPLVMISAFATFMPPDIAISGLVLSVITTNVHQSLRQGLGAALASVRRYWRIIVTLCAGVLVSAQFLPFISQNLVLGLLGVPVLAFAAVQLAGVPLQVRLQHRTRAEWSLGTIGGLYGGISGVWGPPVLVYLLSIGAEKTEIVRVTGVVFLLGAVALLAGHLVSGVMHAETLAFSAALVVPATLGMIAGFRMQDRLDAEAFRRWTQIGLVVIALNLIRLSLMA